MKGTVRALFREEVGIVWIREVIVGGREDGGGGGGV